jgi:K+-sensing histidine kinase KdpD
MLLVGRDTLGEAVIGLLYVVPIAWSAGRWGQAAGMSAALSAALFFDFFFIPPFYTFAVARLESWLVLGIFLGVAIVVVGRIQASLSKAHEATFMYELSSALANTRSQDAVAHVVARYIKQLFQASQVSVSFQQSKQQPRVIVIEPYDGAEKGKPDRVLPILNAWGLVGEIQIWCGEYEDLPSEDGHLLQNFASQAARAFERTQSLELEQRTNGLMQNARTK